jgi:hypothetical protein
MINARSFTVPVMTLCLFCMATALGGGGTAQSNVLDVTNMGVHSVRTDGSVDVTGKLQAIIQRCPDGGAVYFPPGVYPITKSLDISTNCSMLGARGKSVISTRPVNNRGFFVFVTRKRMKKISFRGLVFEGGGIFLESGPHQQVTIRENIFRDFPPEIAPSGKKTTFFERVNIFCSLGLTDSEIADNIFENSPDSHGAELWGPITKVKFNRNYCYNIRQCLHTASWGEARYSSAEFNHNVGLKLSRMGIEIQSLIDDAQIIGNYMAGWRNVNQPENTACAARYGYNCDSMGLSLAFGGLRAVIRNNIILGPSKRFGDATEGGTSFGIELSTGDGSVTTNNFIVNMAPAIEAAYASGSHSINGNYLCGSPYATQSGWNSRWPNSQNTFSANCSKIPWASLLPPVPKRPF